MPETPLPKPIWFWLMPFLSFLVFVGDRLTKGCFVTRPDIQLQLIPDWLWLQLHINTQMALSLPLFPILYYTLTLAILFALVAQLVRAFQKRQSVEFSLIVFILTGAVSNLMDRFYYGGVIDFITIRFGSVFNIADIAIVCGIGLWIIRLFLHDRHKKISTAS